MIFFEQGLERKHRSPAGQFEQWGCCKNKQQNIRSCLGFSAGLLLAAVVLKPYFLPWCSGGVLCHTPRVPKDLWHRQVQERSVAPPRPPTHTPELMEAPQLPLLQIVWLGANAIAPWHCGSPMLSTDSSSPSNSHPRLRDICLLQVADKQPAARWVPFQFSVPTTVLTIKRQLICAY